MKHVNKFLILIGCFILFGFKPNANSYFTITPLSLDTITSISGIFSSYYFTDIDALDNYSKDSINIAEFYPTSVSNQSTTTTFAGDITLNGTSIPFDNNYMRYFQNTSNNINMNVLNWNIPGSGSITPFTYSLTPTYPKFDFSALPDSSTKSLGIYLTLPNLQNTDPTLFICTAILSQDNGAIQTVKVINNASISTNSVFFSTADLAAFNTSSDLDIIITLQNYKYVTIGSQNFAFITSNYYKKESYLY